MYISDEYVDYKDLEVGSVYLSNDPCFPRQLFEIVEMKEPSLRFGKEDRIVKFRRYATLREKGKYRWYLVGTETRWALQEFGKKVPDYLLNELWDDVTHK